MVEVVGSLLVWGGEYRFMDFSFGWGYVRGFVIWGDYVILFKLFI